MVRFDGLAVFRARGAGEPLLVLDCAL